MGPTVHIVGAAESPYTRHPSDTVTTPHVLAAAVVRALADAGVSLGEVDGLGVSSFSLGPDHAVDFAWRAGFGPLRWLMEDTTGGASGINLLQHAVRALESGDAHTIVLVSGDRMDAASFRDLVLRYNSATAEHLSPLPMVGPNALFAHLTSRQMAAFGVEREDYGRLAVSQRSWASQNPGAVYRGVLTLDDYLSAPVVAAPLGRFDCVPPVTGADAIVLRRSDSLGGRPSVRVLAVEATFNHDDQDGDGLVTGLRTAAPLAWERSGVDAHDVDVVSVYDDYPAMIVAQLQGLGLMNESDVSAVITERIATRHLAVNTSGGQLSAGQAGAAAGMHGLVETVTQLLHRAGDRQVAGARLGVVTGYGMVLYRYGACANVAVLERAV